MAFPISVSEAEEWHDSVILDQGPRKEYVSEPHHRSKERPEPQWLRQERQEYLVAKEIARLDANDGEKLDALRQRYDQLARAVLRDHMHLVEKAVWRRFVTSEASFPEYISALAVVVDRWQKVLDVEGDE